MRILGIDPSMSEPAFALLENHKLIYTYKHPKCKNADPWNIVSATDRVFTEISFQPEWIATEKPVGTFMRTARMMNITTGIVYGVAHGKLANNFGLLELTPLDWSKTLGFTNAKGKLNLSSDERRSLAILYCKEHYGLITTDHDIASAICIASAAHALIMQNTP